MVMGLHRAGLRVIQDVVFNHTVASGQTAKSVLDRVVPGYYHRYREDGTIETTSCGDCSNTASDRRLPHALPGSVSVFRVNASRRRRARNVRLSRSHSRTETPYLTTEIAMPSSCSRKIGSAIDSRRGFAAIASFLWLNGLIALACLATASAIATAAPAWSIRVGLVTLAALDVILVWGTPSVQNATTTLENTPLPHAAGRSLPGLQQAIFGSALMGWLDLLAPAHH